MKSTKDFGPVSKVKEPVLKDMEREQYDLKHWSMTIGAIGSLMTISTIPVVAGDSMQVNLSSVFRTSPLRRNLFLDMVVDLFAFYIPHRHIYGSNWVNFINAGIDESVTLGTDTIPNVTIGCLGLKTQTNSANPRWLTRGYIQIWNRYFRDPSDVAGIKSEDYFTTATDSTVDVGLPCCHLKTMTTAALLSTIGSADYQLALDSGTVNLQQFAQQQGRLKTELRRDWFDLRYSDVLRNSWGTSGVNSDADQRPTLLMRTTQWMSGYDVDGTDDATLGTYSGKATAVCKLNMPFKFFPEHGTLWLMALVRYPFVHDLETHYLVTKPEPTYKQIAGDPDIIMREPQVDINLNETFIGASSVALGSVPYGQWYRTHPGFVHHQYRTVQGHPFLTSLPSDRNDHIYIASTDYDDVFQSRQYKHWNAQSYVDVIARRFIPIPEKSLFAGTE